MKEGDNVTFHPNSILFFYSLCEFEGELLLREEGSVTNMLNISFIPFREISCPRLLAPFEPTVAPSLVDLDCPLITELRCYAPLMS